MFNSSRAVEATTGCGPRGAEMLRRHHRLQCRLDRPPGIGEEIGDAGERLVGLGVKHVQDRADEQRMAGLLPVIAALQRAFGIDENVGDVLHVAHLGGPAPHLEQRIIGGGLRVGRIEQQHAPEARTPAGGERPILALDVMDDRRARPGKQRRHDEADALAGSRRCEAEHMLWPVMAQIVACEAPEHDALLAEQARGAHFAGRRPARRAIAAR